MSHRTLSASSFHCLKAGFIHMFGGYAVPMAATCVGYVVAATSGLQCWQKHHVGTARTMMGCLCWVTTTLRKLMKDSVVSPFPYQTSNKVITLRCRPSAHCDRCSLWMNKRNTAFVSCSVTRHREIMSFLDVTPVLWIYVCSSVSLCNTK